MNKFKFSINFSRSRPHSQAFVRHREDVVPSLVRYHGGFSPNYYDGIEEVEHEPNEFYDADHRSTEA